MMDRWLTPEDGGDSEAGKAVLRQIAAAAWAQLAHVKQAKDEQMIKQKEAANDR
jgi:hypothetical protein